MATQSIQPLGSRLLVKRLEAEEKTTGGIIIPDSAKEKAQQAKVIALGTGGKDDEGHEIVFHVKEGDRVLLSKYGGTEVKVRGEEHLILKQEDILAIIQD